MRYSPTRRITAPLSLALAAGRYAFLESTDTDDGADDTVELEIPTLEDGSLDLSGFDDSGLGGLEAQLVQAFNDLHTDAPSDDDLAEMERLAGLVEGVRAEATQRAEAAQARADSAAALAGRVGAPDPAVDTEPAADTADSADAAVEGDAGSDAAEGADEPQALAASAGPIRVRARNVSAPTAPPAADNASAVTATLVASAGTGTHVAVGDPVPFPTVSSAAERAAALNDLGDRFGRALRANLSASGHVFGLHIEFQYPETHVLDGSADDAEKLAALDDPEATTVESLTAAGCGPVQPVYDLLDETSVGALLTVPEMMVERNGVSFPVSPGMNSIVAALAVEAYLHSDSSTDKAVVSVACPARRPDLELQARPLILEHDNFTRRMAPEVWANLVGLAMKAHQIAKSTDTLTRMLTASGTNRVDYTATGVGDYYPDGAAPTALIATELLVETVRSRHMIYDRAIECVAPRWARAAIRADVARVHGIALELVNDAMIDSWFATVGARVQFIDHWDRINPGGANYAAAQLSHRDSFPMLAYPANTFVRITGGALDLGEVRDSVLNTNNKFQTFTEEWYNTGLRHYDAVLAKIPSKVTGGRAPLSAAPATVAGTALTAADDRPTF